MKKAWRRILGVFLVLALSVTLFAACGNVEQSNSPTTAAQESAKKEEATTESKTPVTIKYWVDMPSDKVAPVFKNMAEIEMYKELESRTGVKVEFMHPPAGQANEQFNLMIASRDLPDVIERNFQDSGAGGYPGGPEKAIADGVIIKLNDLIDKNAPNLKKLFTDNKDYDKLSKTDNGTYYTFPFIRGDDALMVFFGPQFRKDWLDEVGLAVPETIDEWYTVLKAFKEKKKVEFPFSFRQNPGSGANDLGGGDGFIGAWGIAKGYYIEDGKVKFGSIEPSFKDCLKTLNQWFDEKLIDPDFASQDLKTWRAKVTDNKVGAYMGLTGGGMGYFYDLVKANDPTFALVGAPNPTLKKGEKSHFGQKDWPVSNACAQITTTNKHPEETAKWLDYGYGPEGHILFNFGIEGKSFTMQNDYPKYTDWVVKNPEGKSMALAMSTYMRSHYNGPFVQDKRYFEQFLKYPDQLKAVETWAGSSTFDRRLPKITATPDESTTFATIMNEINTYVDEMFLKFVMGQESIDKFDDYVAQVRKMKIDEALAIQQAALERYNKR
jgi:putative aldouronate transport system substrate-binding protein